MVFILIQGGELLENIKMYWSCVCKFCWPLEDFYFVKQSNRKLRNSSSTLLIRRSAGEKLV
jgi:hypothetical protein